MAAGESPSQGVLVSCFLKQPGRVCAKESVVVAAPVSTSCPQGGERGGCPGSLWQTVGDVVVCRVAIRDTQHASARAASPVTRRQLLVCQVTPGV
jgi:hypothetical protein